LPVDGPSTGSAVGTPWGSSTVTAPKKKKRWSRTLRGRHGSA
jgi:hypothetical protein